MGLWKERPNDSFGIASSFTHISPDVRQFDAETAVFTNMLLPLRNYELVFELTYEAQIIPGWTVQPDFQYIFHSGAEQLIRSMLLRGVFPMPLLSDCARKSVSGR